MHFTHISAKIQRKNLKHFDWRRWGGRSPLTTPLLHAMTTNFSSFTQIYF